MTGKADTKTPVTITYFTDILCIWAWIAERRLAEIRRVFSDQVSIEHRFIPLFGDTEGKFDAGWSSRGGVAGYAAHVHETVAAFDHITVHKDVWTCCRPASSLPTHLVLRAIGLTSQDPMAVECAATLFRHAFFEEARDISATPVLKDLTHALGHDWAAIEAAIEDGTAFAALHRDALAQQDHRIEGSPTFLLNNGRQKLYGNVGFRIVEANIQEVLRRPYPDQATWC